MPQSGSSAQAVGDTPLSSRPPHDWTPQGLYPLDVRPACLTTRRMPMPISRLSRVRKYSIPYVKLRLQDYLVEGLFPGKELVEPHLPLFQGRHLADVGIHLDPSRTNQVNAGLVFSR